MSKHNFFIKKLRHQILSINVSIESYFTKLKFLILNFRKVELIKNNRVFFSLSALVILTLSYFLLPTIYDKNKISTEIENQVLKKYNIDIRSDKNFRYSLLPKPNFVIKDLLILNGKREIGLVKTFKAYIKINNFFSSKNLEITDLVFNKTDFNVNYEDIPYFKKLLETPPNETASLLKKVIFFLKTLMVKYYF